MLPFMPAESDEGELNLSFKLLFLSQEMRRGGGGLRKLIPNNSQPLPELIKTRKKTNENGWNGIHFNFSRGSQCKVNCCKEQKGQINKIKEKT
uniref:Uncharacterized protein n=1 Tax=Anopheles atroparvus TaxID=41427 RepID=A0AAG5DLA2_ANOAO